MGLSACSPAESKNIAPAASPVTSASASATSNPAATESSAKTAEVANTRINAFMAAVKADVAKMTPDASVSETATDAEKTAAHKVFEKEFANSLSFIDATKVSDDESYKIIEGFGAIYLMDPNAAIVSKDAKSVAIAGDTATIRGRAFTVTVGGKTAQGTSENDGALSLTFTNGEWKITDYKGATQSK